MQPRKRIVSHLCGFSLDNSIYPQSNFLAMSLVISCDPDSCPVRNLPLYTGFVLFPKEQTTPDTSKLRPYRTHSILFHYPIPVFPKRKPFPHSLHQTLKSPLFWVTALWESLHRPKDWLNLSLAFLGEVSTTVGGNFQLVPLILLSPSSQPHFSCPITPNHLCGLPLNSLQPSNALLSLVFTS